MTAAPLTRAWRLTRAATAALALTAAALTVSGSASTHDDAAASSGGAPVADCLSAAPNHRVRADSGLDGVDPNDLSAAQAQRAEAKLAGRMRQRSSSSSSSSSKVTIDVYVHVIKRTSGTGGVSTKRIKKQISVLNSAYAGKTSSHSTKTGFSFKLKKIDSVKNSDWYHWSPDVVGDDDDLAAKTKLHRGGFDDLNLYVADLEQDLLGYATFPWDTTLKQDGVVVLNTSLPGGSAKGYNKGDTATHEVGHWLGLLHTFEGGCTAPGDYVDDTAYQANGTNIFSCDTTLDTCPQTGKDPVHNFMSYGDDGCLNRFTKGQTERMHEAWVAFRKGGASA